MLTGCILATEKQLPYWRDGETLFRRAIAVTHNNEIALVNLGVALAAQHRYEEALAAYRQAEKIAPERYQLHNNLGNLLKLLGRHQESLAEYQEAVRLRPDIAFLRNALGNQLRTVGQREEALKEFAEAIRLNPRYAQPHVEIALTLFQLGRDTEAVDELRTALQLEPDNYQILATTAHHLAANDNEAARNGRAALVLATKASALTGGNQPMVFDVLGMALAETGDFTNAQICVENALTLATAAKMKGLEPLHQRLELYKNRQPWRESFRATNAPAKAN
jgi:tetratricopeptide (TPR) repeat protein